MKFLESLEAPRSNMYEIGRGLFCLEECTDFQKGLSGRDHMGNKNGMIFKFDGHDQRSFHMKGCLIPLDILFIKNNKIEKIYHNCSPCMEEECEKYTCDSADTVIELPGGTCERSGISEGLVYRLI